MAREHRTKEELVNASQHLHYEFWMFKSLANALAIGVFGQGVANNAILESFTIHARNLLYFLYSDTPWPDDVIADDFLKVPEAWKSHRPVMSETLGGVHERVAKEVAHLTYARQDVTPEMKLWPFIEIMSEVNTIFSKFLDLVEPDLLSPGWHSSEQALEEGDDSA